MLKQQSGFNLRRIIFSFRQDNQDNKEQLFIKSGRSAKTMKEPTCVEQGTYMKRERDA